MSNENLESRITAVKTNIAKFMGTPNVVRYSIILNERTKEGYELMSELYREITNAIGIAPNFTRDSQEKAFHEWLERPELNTFKWTTEEGLGALVNQGLLKEGKEHAFQTFVGVTIYPVGKLKQREAYITAQIAGDDIFIEAHDRMDDTEIKENEETRLFTNKDNMIPEINGMEFTLIIDTTKHEFESLFDEIIGSYARLRKESKPKLIKYN